MNMNEREWNDIWDNEPEEDDDDYNDVGSDVDANNDETFDNAAEWNEDEHEELIARDSILSHKTSRPTNNSSNNNYNNNINNFHQRQHQHLSGLNHLASNPNNASNNNVFPPTSTRQVLTVDELEQQLLRARISSQNNDPTAKMPSMEASHSILNNELYKRSGWSPFGGKDLFAGSSSPGQQIPMSSIPNNLIIGNQLPQSLTLEQQQQLLLHQHHLLQQQQQQLLRQQQLQQMALKQAQIEQEQKLMSQNPQCFTVEELERQMFAAARSSNTKPEDSKMKPEQPQLKHFALMAAYKPDLDRMMEEQNQKSQTNVSNNKNRREIDKHERNDRLEREPKEIRDTRRENRENRDQRESRNFRERKKDNHRDHNREGDLKDSRDNHHNHHHHRNHNRRAITIIPPQVQLRVIDKAKRLHSITAMHSDEFLQDRLPTSEHGFLFKRHSIISYRKANHDGVLTEKERNWLTKIQEKIQADYDDNLDQDYYYLLYFNRSSMADGATQKPGPGVLDRRFIPRERLLYNTGT